MGYSQASLGLPLLGRTNPEAQNRPSRPIKKIIVLMGFSMFLLALVAIITLNGGGKLPQPPVMVAPERGKTEGVSEKFFRPADSGEGLKAYPWTNDMLMWQSSGYHFQPPKNWMNDPNGPLYHKGYYHLFYQYNPDSAVWGNITWGHAVSTDLIHWNHLPISILPDQWYDINGVWTGSATILPDGNITMLYTGDTDQYMQVQNLAYPANLSDPLLLEWVKYPGNPVLTPPKGIGYKDFRDPTTAWVGADGVWRVMIGSKINKRGISLVYKTRSFTSFELVSELHGVPGTGMWECVDFYPVSTLGQNGLDNSANGPGMKHLLKASLDEKKQDYYALGRYDVKSERWVPDNQEMDVGIGLRLDNGKFYASKSFYDEKKRRRILWGWVGETDTEADDLLKGWASLQAIPRVVTHDAKTGANILQWPVEEVKSLRTLRTDFDSLILQPGSLINLNITPSAQLDINAEFVLDPEAVERARVGDDVINNCSPTVVRKALGPFGLLVMADASLSELTPVYFYIAKASHGTLTNWFCTDLSRSTKASGVDKQIYGGTVPVQADENYKMRLLVDHSIVEAFAQGGRSCTTSRIYPTKAINGAARVFLFNNSTDLSVIVSAKIWKLKSANNGAF